MSAMQGRERAIYTTIPTYGKERRETENSETKGSEQLKTNEKTWTCS